MSIPRRSRLASHPCTMCLRDSPRMLGRSFMGKFTFVAMTSSSSRANFFSARPTTSSLTPREYMSAVSKKLMPASMARRKKGLDSFSPRIHGRHLGSP